MARNVPYTKDFLSKFNKKYDLSKRNFQKIIDFYVINCPVKGVSKRGTTLKDFGFHGGNVHTLTAAMKKSGTKSLKDAFHPCEIQEIQQEYEKVSFAHPPEEYCIFYKQSKDNIPESLIYSIRCALSHGSFNVKKYNQEVIYFFANDRKGTPRARIILQEKTLLSWIDLITQGMPLDNQSKKSA